MGAHCWLERRTSGREHSGRSVTGQCSDRPLARPRSLSGRLRSSRRIQPAPGPIGRRGHPVHPCTCHRATVLTLARFPFHRAIPTEQWPNRTGSSRLGIPRRGAHTPHILSGSGWHTALFGMQHESAYPATLGFDEYDVSNSYCEYVVEHATRWLRNSPQSPFLLTAGFF